MARVGHHHITFRLLCRSSRRHQGPAKFRHALAFFGRKEKHLRVDIACTRRFAHSRFDRRAACRRQGGILSIALQTICLVDRNNHPTFCPRTENFVGQSGQLAFCTIHVDHKNHRARQLQLPPATLDAHLLHAVCRVAQSRRVDEAKQYPAQHKGVFHHIAGRTVHIAHNRTIVLKQRIEQGRFAGIGCTDNGHRPSFAQRIARRKRVGQSGGLPLHGGRYGIELTAIGKL